MVDKSSTSLPILQSDSSSWTSDTDKAKHEKKEKLKIKSVAQPDSTQAGGKKKRKKSITICLANCRYDVIRRICNKFSYKECSDVDNWNLYWTDLSISIERCKEMKRFQKINHFPGMLEICRKDLLARNLNRMQRLFPKDYSFFPKTWCLPADLGEALTYGRLRKNKTYILKPDAGSQGRGIMITKNLKDIKPSDRVICQVYIARPYLIDGYKFDLRIYTLITSCDPLRVFIHKEGLVRFATSRYKEPHGVNVTNVFMHLTNYAVNKHSRLYTVDNEAGSKRKLTWFNGYVRNLGHDCEKLWRNIDDVIVKTVMSAWPILKHSYMACFPNHDVIPACCELLGVDIILDKRLNPLILEVNHSPSFHTDTDLDAEVKESILSDMFAMLNLEQCDKRKVIKEDKKRIRERLLQGITNSCGSNEPKNFADYYKHEMKHRGGFRLVYPTTNSDHIYDKYFHQGQSSLYCETASSKARETAQTALRDEMNMKAKMEAAKRIPSLKPPSKSKLETSSAIPPPPPKKFASIVVPPAPHIRDSFEPQMIVESEEKERLLRLSQRDYLVRSNGLLEYVYFSMKANGTLRPQDERKYAIYDKIKNMTDNKLKPTVGPAITDLLDGIRNDERNAARMSNGWTFLDPQMSPGQGRKVNKLPKVNTELYRT